MNKGGANVGDGGHKIGNYGCAPERYLSSGKNIADEGSCYNEKKKDNSHVSGFFIKVRAVVQTSADMCINT